MNAIHMIDDYRLLCANIQKLGKFEAYKTYTQKYPHFFESVFRYLYCQSIENLQPMIEQIDFDILLQTAENNYKSGMVDYALCCINKFIENMHVDFEFSFLLGLELSNIGGCATPIDGDVPHLYIGIDKPLDKEWIDLFIPHEMFHMLRYNKLQDNSSETVFSRTIEEGLASYASLWVHDMEWSITNIAKTLSISETQADNLLRETDTLLAKLISDGKNPISPEMMNEYFVVQSYDVDFPVVGYYIGLYLTHMSVENGINFESFASMSKGEIMDMWFK